MLDLLLVFFTHPKLSMYRIKCVVVIIDPPSKMHTVLKIIIKKVQQKITKRKVFPLPQLTYSEKLFKKNHYHSYFCTFFDVFSTLWKYLHQISLEKTWEKDHQSYELGGDWKRVERLTRLLFMKFALKNSLRLYNLYTISCKI